MLPKKEQIPTFQIMYDHAFGIWEKKHKLAAEFFGVSEQTCRRWYLTNQPHEIAKRYLFVHYKGYLPFATGWKDCTIDSEGVLHTPWGSCLSSDVAFVWRYKWSAEQSARQVKTLRNKLDEITSGTKYQLLLHTADYLNRLVQDFSSKK